MPVQRTAGSGRATTAAVTVTTAGVLPAHLAGVLSVQLRADLGIDPSLLGQRSRCRAAGGWGRPPGRAAQATSTTQGGVGPGAALGPLAVGAVVPAASYTVAWTATAALAVLGGLVCLVGRQMLLRERPALVAAHRQRRTTRAS
jgi:hypothetical protein